jgi:hypothetical protein
LSGPAGAAEHGFHDGIIRPCYRSQRRAGVNEPPLINFAAVDCNGGRRGNPDADLIAAAPDNHDADVAVDHNLFAWPTG